jgi:hypothetical protein
MGSNVIAQATAVAAVLRDTADGDDFADAVKRFLQLLVTVPDHPAGSFSTAEIATLASLAEDVILRIERRVVDGTDATADQQWLVGAEYQIRLALEEIDHWQRHFLRQKAP